MAIMKNVLIGACALISVAQAAPRFITVTDVVTQTHWETVNCTTTVWRPINESPLPTTTTDVSVSTSTTTTTPVITSSSTTTSVYVAPVVATTPSTTSVYVAPTPTTTPATTPAPVATTPVQAAATVATTLSTSAVAAKASSTAVAQAGSFVQGSSSGTCEGQGNACVGDITHWDGGLGACGWSVDTSSDMAIALPYGFMGTQSNGNPYCGRAVTLLDPATGITVQAKVGDKCMGCVDRAIDTTDALFKAVTGGTGDGRVSNIEWWFT